MLKQEYKSLCKKYKTTVANFHNDKENNVMHSNNKKLFYSYIKKKLRTPLDLPPLLNNNGELLFDPVDKANLLNSTFAKVFSKDNNQTYPTLSPHKQNFDNMPHREISTQDILFSIKRLKNSVTRTPDQIPAHYIKNTCYSLLEPLQMIYSHSLNTGQVPIAWRKAQVVAIYKKGEKNDPAITDPYP